MLVSFLGFAINQKIFYNRVVTFIKHNYSKNESSSKISYQKVCLHTVYFSEYNQLDDIALCLLTLNEGEGL